MEVTFQSKSRAKGIKSKGRGQIVINKSGKAPIVFNNGRFTTTNKDEIRELLHSRLYDDGTIVLSTDMELVNGYLEGNEPDRLTEEVLLRVSDEGLREICKANRISEQKHQNYSEMMRSMLKGKPMTNVVRAIIKKNQKEEPAENIQKRAEEAGIIYRNAPWYKYRVGEEKDSEKDKAIGKNPDEVAKFIAQNREEILERLD